MSVPTTSEAQNQFRELVLMSREVERKKVNIFQNAENSTLA